MAVEAQKLHFFPSQLVANREAINTGNNHMSFFTPFYSTVTTTTAAPQRDLPPMKRSRNIDDICCYMRQHQLEMDSLIAQHVEDVVTELAQGSKQYTKRVLMAVEAKAMSRLKAKDEEIESIKKVNLALEERVKRLCVERQVWRELAQANEAAVNALRCDIQQLLIVSNRVKVNEEELHDGAEDAESCCEGEGNEVARSASTRLCKNCREFESSVLLLPCRHLCVCFACSARVEACPVCSCGMIGSINVNLS